MAYFIIYVTCDSKNVAKNIAKIIIEEKLTICVNIIENVSSIYYWEDRIQESEELILITKVTVENLDKSISRIKDLHNYDCPSIIAVPFTKGNEDYLKLYNL